MLYRVFVPAAQIIMERLTNRLFCRFLRNKRLPLRISFPPQRRLQAAFTEYKSGNIECEHTVAYSKAKFLTPVRLIAENEMTVDKYKWKHINIWHCPYYMHAGISHFKQIVLQDDENYIRAIKPQFCELRYAIEEQSESQDKIGVMFCWGVPEMIKYDSRTKKTRLYLYEERYSDKATACRDLDNAEKINLRSFCDEIFGDG